MSKPRKPIAGSTQASRIAPYSEAESMAATKAEAARQSALIASSKDEKEVMDWIGNVTAPEVWN